MSAPGEKIKQPATENWCNSRHQSHCAGDCGHHPGRIPSVVTVRDNDAGQYGPACPAEALDEAPVSRVTLRELAKEPDFAPMLETRYARSFHLPQGN